MLKQKDFIEIEFTGKVKDTEEIFDSNIKSDLEKLNSKAPAKPFIFSLGQGMFLKALDDYLIENKAEVGKEYTIELPSDKAFGPRLPQMIQLMPMSVFRKQNVNPIQGMTFNFDGRIGKILSVNGGRVRVDFNNPIAGKDVVYKIKILHKIEDTKKQVSSFMDFLFRKEFPFEIDKKSNKIIVDLEKEAQQFQQIVPLFSEKFKEILGMDLEVKEAGNKTKANSPKESQ